MNTQKIAFTWACQQAAAWGWTWDWEGAEMFVATDHGWEVVTARDFVGLVSTENKRRHRKL